MGKPKTSDRRPVAPGATPAAAEFDLFLSHASEDKTALVRPLAAKLTKLGLKVWTDWGEIKVGDSLSRAIDDGLARSRFGVVVLSAHFFAKRWPERELSGLVAREINGTTRILPVWFDVTEEDVLRYSPPLADKMAAIATRDNIPEVAAKLFAAVRPDLPSQPGAADSTSPTLHEREIGVLWSQRADIPEHRETIRFSGKLVACVERRESSLTVSELELFARDDGTFLVYTAKIEHADWCEAWLDGDPACTGALRLSDLHERYPDLATAAGLQRVRYV